MSQSIGHTIKILRKERNLTQEELAEQLNVTSQAVSKWENETGMPDISQIVPLASVFGVSTDVLFGTFGTTDDEEVKKLITKLHTQSKTGEISEYQAYLEKIAAQKIYPNNNQLLYSCLINGIMIICTELADTEKLDNDKKQEIFNECVREAELIISYCRQPNLVINTHRQLIFLYSVFGKYDKAHEHITELPTDIEDIRGLNETGISIHEGNFVKTIELCNENIYTLLDSLQSQIIYLGNAYMKANDAVSARKTFETLISIFNTVSDTEGYMPPFHLGQSVFAKLASISIRNGNTDEAMLYLEKMYDYTCTQAAGYNKTLHVKSPLLCKHTMEFNYSDYEPREMMDRELSQKCFDPIRDTQRFKNLLTKVETL